MTHRIPNLILAAFTAVLFTTTAMAAPAPAPESADELALDETQIKSINLRFTKASDAQEYVVARLPAIVAPPANARVAVAATYPGVVLQTLAAEGDIVKRGQTLAIVSSREVLALSSELAQARARLAVAERNAERQTLLSKEGIVAGARAEEADAELRAARAEAAAKGQIAAAIDADAKGSYKLIAPIDGVVSSAKVATGAAVEDLAAAYVVDAVDTYEIQAQVPERLIGQIEPGMRVEFEGGAAKVTSVGRVVQPETRSANLKALTPSGTKIVAGRTTTVAIYADAGKGAVKIPRAGLIEVEGEDVVFVRTRGGVTARKVTAASSIGADAVVTAGLRAGEEVAISNLSELKSLALSK